MNMQVSNFGAAQIATNGGSLSTIVQDSSKTSPPATSSVASTVKPAVPSSIQQKYDAAQVRLANAYAMAEGGPFNLFSQAREGEIQNARRTLSDMRQDFPGLVNSQNGNGVTTSTTGIANVPSSIQQKYDAAQVRLANAYAMPEGGPFNLFSQAREGEIQNARRTLSDMRRDFPGLLDSQNGNGVATSNTSTTVNKTTAASTTVVSSNAASTVNSVNSNAASTTAAKPSEAATAEEAKSASGALGAYMHSNNIDAVDVNKLYDIANNSTGQVPEDVQKAAAFMVKNPAAYKAIETNDIAGADGISARANFDKAAQGLVEFNQPAAGKPAAASKLNLAQQTKNASGTLAAYMRADNIGSVDMNQLYAIANNSDRQTSDDVRNAAAFMLKNPDAYRTIETNDVGGVDGISGLSNFENMAMGKIKLAESSSTASTTVPDKKIVKQTKSSVDTSVAAPALSLAQEGKRAAGTLAAYVRSNNVDLVDPNMLYTLTMNADKKASKDVQKAASFILTRPDTFKAIETSIWSVVDGRASAEDLNRAAQGMTKLS
jgi:hypothetical protein